MVCGLCRWGRPQPMHTPSPESLAHSMTYISRPCEVGHSHKNPALGGAVAVDLGCTDRCSVVRGQSSSRAGLKFTATN